MNEQQSKDILFWQQAAWGDESNFAIYKDRAALVRRIGGNLYELRFSDAGRVGAIPMLNVSADELRFAKMGIVDGELAPIPVDHSEVFTDLESMQIKTWGEK